MESAFKKIKDISDQAKIDYIIPAVYKCAFAMFFFQDKSLLEFQRQLNNKYRRHNLATVYTIKDIPKDTQLRDIIDMHSNEHIFPVFKDFFLKTSKVKIY